MTDFGRYNVSWSQIEGGERLDSLSRTIVRYVSHRLWQSLDHLLIDTSSDLSVCFSAILALVRHPYAYRDRPSSFEVPVDAHEVTIDSIL